MLRYGRQNGEFDTGSILGDKSCLTWEELRKYVGKDIKTFYGWYISELKIYDKPKELEWFRKCHKCKYGPLERCNRHEFSCDGTYKIVNPPQSWCYVEELK